MTAKGRPTTRSSSGGAPREDDGMEFRRRARAAVIGGRGQQWRRWLGFTVERAARGWNGGAARWPGLPAGGEAGCGGGKARERLRRRRRAARGGGKRRWLGFAVRAALRQDFGEAGWMPGCDVERRSRWWRRRSAAMATAAVAGGWSVAEVVAARMHGEGAFGRWFGGAEQRPGWGLMQRSRWRKRRGVAMTSAAAAAG
uniref:Uncharacterized protein n=1 Tax=Oryza meridionalis TaxID=40149 RepID=A0A0E0DQF4_9ORYZ